MAGGLRSGLAARALAVLEGRVLGHRPSVTRIYRGLETLTDQDVVVVHNRPEGLPAVPAGALRVLHLHNDVLRHYSRRELRRLSGQVDLVVCVSRSLADRLPDEMAAPHAVVLNGVDSTLFRPREDETPRAVPTVLFCGRVIPDKGVHLLIQAVVRLRSLPFRLRVVGAGSPGHALSGYERRLRRAVDAAGLADRVVFDRALRRSDIPLAMRDADVLAVPSTWPDPCPLVVLEGLASGLPVIAARTGGIPELGGTVCRYHEPADVDSLTGALAELIEDAGVRRQLGTSGRQRALLLGWNVAERRLAAAIDGQRTS
jgi:glycosyltransferase involved in cell wall biosynthesis